MKDRKSLLKEVYKNLQERNFGLALSLSENLYQQDQDVPEVAISYAWALLENGNPFDALEISNSLVQNNPENIKIRLYRGYFLLRMSIYGGSLSDLNWVLSRTIDSEELSWGMLNKARALAGLEKYEEGLAEVEKLLKLKNEKDKKLNKLKSYFLKILNQEFIKNLAQNKKVNLIEDAEEAYASREYWFVFWLCNQILSNYNFAEDHKKAAALELKCLIESFQYRFAITKAKGYLEQFKNDEDISFLLTKANSLFSSANERKEEPFHDSKGYVIYDDEDFKILHIKTFDLLQNLNVDKRNYILQFDHSKIRYIGAEIAVVNPYYRKKKIEVEAFAKWYLNDYEVGSHKFNLVINKEWNVVEFVQSWGTEKPGFWKRGEGRVDIYLERRKVCSRWFSIGKEEIVNLEQNELELEYIQKLEEENKRMEQEDTPTTIETSTSLDTLFEELNNLTGLQTVKQSVKDLIDYLKFLSERKKSGFKTQENILFNCVFLGNPGTGKTSVARLLAKILKEIGILSHGHIVEVDRAALVGQYIGETAQKTDKIINDASGGLLFIDEAYTLKKEGSSQDFGQEAIDILLKRMEDKKGEFAVIVAGYPDEMRGFINSNPGLKSRFTNFFFFEDYNPDELIDIFKSFIKKEEYNITPEAIELLKKKFVDLYRARDNTFGNARLVRNYFDEAKLQLSKRYVKLPEEAKNKESLTTITSQDLNFIVNSGLSDKYKLNINHEVLDKALTKLNSFIGLNNVKKEIDEIVRLVKFYIEQGEDPQNKISSHLIFLGSPGTGKTTIARLYSEIFSALGILPKGHLIEADRQSLVGTYVGETAAKTTRIIDKSLGGTLFIDEAYTLVKETKGNDFGQEAIDTLLKRMEDDRGKFIVIAAGYTDEMINFLNSNPGLQSRFSKKILFEDYSPEEMLEITEKFFSEKNHILDLETKPHLMRYFNQVYKDRDKTFGNARFIRNFVDHILKNHILRIAEVPQEERSEKDLKHINLNDIKDLLNDPITRYESENEEKGLDELLDELKMLAGLDEVKQKIDKLVKSLMVAKLRQERGLKVIPKNLNAIFTGNPGTGKKTIAKLLGKIYKELNVLEKGHFVDVDKSLITSSYQGQTSNKLNNIIQSALGGILFIENAPLLLDDESGREALEILYKKIEEHTGSLVVILSGLPSTFNGLFNNNPNAATYFPNYFEFPDFNPRELLEIALTFTEKNGYKLDEGAWQLLLEVLTKVYDKRGEYFDNIKAVRSILYKAINNQEERILSIKNPDNEQLCTIIYEDLKLLI